jgi:hypothetical protein
MIMYGQEGGEEKNENNIEAILIIQKKEKEVATYHFLIVHTFLNSFFLSNSIIDGLKQHMYLMS